MDELSALPPEGALLWSGTRRSSRGLSRYSTHSPAITVTSTQRAVSPMMSPNTDVNHLLLLPESNTINDDNIPVILAPTPRRHLIESSVSHYWLNTPPETPISPNYSSQSFLKPANPQNGVLPQETQAQGGFVFPSSSSSSLRDGVKIGPVPAGAVRRRVSTSRRQSLSNALLELNTANLEAHNTSGMMASPSTATAARNVRVRTTSSSSYLRPNGTGRSMVLTHASHHNGVHEYHDPGEPAMGRRWIRWMHKRGMKQWVLPGIVMVAVLFKWAIGLGSYSGQATPPMYGDYEAQRHWMEITLHLPFKQWYSYDLPYWGLDYPPLTAYVSWICGYIANIFSPSWVALDSSRGIESVGSKVFMRFSVLVLDTLVYVPALLLFSATWQGSRSKRTQELAVLTLIMQPALLLIDFGHFQYNAVMLGFTLLAMNFFAMEQDLWGAFFFVLSLGFKQMALYYAPAIGSYLIAKCLYLGPTQGTRLFIRLALVTSVTFAVLFLPWLPPFAPLSGTSSIFQPIIRIFPFARGLFEDKVANFWCATNVVFKWKRWAGQDLLMKMSTLLTALGFLPAVVGMIRCGAGMSLSLRVDAPVQEKGKEEDGSEKKETEPTPFLALLPYALLTSAMSFFLFSFQVHEKTILLLLLPITLLLSGAPIDSAAYSWGTLVNNVGVFSMWPLLKKDGLGIQYLAMLLIWNRLIGYNPFKTPKTFVQLLSVAVYSAAVFLHLVEMVVSPPARYPDIYPVLNVLISTPVFLLAWLWSIKCGMEVGWAVSGVKKHSKTKTTTTTTTEVAANASN